MTVSPSTLRDLAAYWIAQGGVNLGIVGDDAHQARPSYHNGQDVINANGWTAMQDYSIRHARDREPNLTNAAAAIDLGKLDDAYMGLQEFSRWLVAQCQARAPGSGDVREIIYSPDGASVQRYSGVDGKIHTGAGNGDASHRFHTHISYFRDSEGRDKVPLFAPYFIEGDDDMTIRSKLIDPTQGIATVAGDGHALITFTGKRVPVPAGQEREVISKASLLEPLDAHSGDRQTVYIIAGIPGGAPNTELAYLLAVDATFKAKPGSAVAIAVDGVIQPQSEVLV